MPSNPFRSTLVNVLLLLELCLALPALAALPVGLGRVELLRDQWGIPHVFADTEAGAMYGLGYAAAEERGFQMTFSLRIMQGRLAELLGPRARPGRTETAVDSDRRFRTFGWAPAAARIAPQLDHATRELLGSYCLGVNRAFADQRAEGRLHPLFEELGVTNEDWTPAHCLLSWWHLAQFFAGDGTRDLMIWRNRVQPPPGQPQPPEPNPLWADDSAAVVQRADVNDEWLREAERFGKEMALPASDPGLQTAPAAPKFSHAWVVGRKKTTTGSAVLVSDPQTPVRNPSLWMEFHVQGGGFDARGVGVPGSPGLLIGFNRHVAWGLTALGADQADLFRLETQPDHPNQYRWNGQWREMKTRVETILVRGGPTVTLTVRETHLGPVVSDFAYRQPGDPDVALKRVPLCDNDRDTIQGVFAMMRARDASAFIAALPQWRFPSANCVFGDSGGHIGFAVLGAIPVRPPSPGAFSGGEALPGNADDHDWRGFIPASLLPRVIDPAAGYLFSANHRPIGSFYPLPLGTSTGALGDTMRSWRLRERLALRDQFTPEQVLDIHFDTVNPARRDLVRLGLHLKKTQPETLSQPALQALVPLEKWLSSGASSDLRAEHADLANRLSTFFRFVVTPLARQYGGGESGLARFLKNAVARVNRDPQTLLNAEEFRFIDRVLAEAWSPRTAGERGINAPRLGGERLRLAWLDTLDGFGSLDPARDRVAPAITCLDGQTLKCQSSQSYTQWVPLHDVNASLAVCPIGHSDRPNSPWSASTLELWGRAELHPAPLARHLLEPLCPHKRVLSP